MLKTRFLALLLTALAPFAARAEPALGTLGSLAGLGGIWNAEATPYSRTTPFALLATAVLDMIEDHHILAMLASTEAGEPLLATWRYGLGQTAAFTSDAKSRWAAEWFGVTDEADAFSARIILGLGL